MKLFWIHPYLERGELHKNDEDDEDHNLAFSKYNQNSKWQSGPVSNSPTNSDCLLNSGFWTQPAGLNDVPLNNPEETKLYFRRAYQGHDSSLYRIGYSRGNDTVLYGDSGTEGLEYGCVGMSGFFTALPNESFHDDKYNVGVEHAYTINRICTSLDELGYNIKKFVEWLQDILETLEDLDNDLPEGIGGSSVSTSSTGEYTPGSIRLDPTDLLNKLRSDPDKDPTDEQKNYFRQLSGNLEAL